MSKRQTDVNGFVTIKENPITKVGVFPYLGKEIGAPDPGRVYMVLRPREELEKLETIESANLVPWIDEHEVLGKNATPAENKGVQGTTGEVARYEHPYLYNTIRVFSDHMHELIDRGKVELSPAYRCKYEFTPGVYEGQKYDAIQRDIRFNHLALVGDGRTGPDIAVQDHQTIITIDTAELINMEFTEEQLAQIRALIAEILAAKQPAADELPEEKPTGDGDTPPKPAADEVKEADAVAAVAAAQEAVEAVQEAVAEVQAAAEEVQAIATSDSMDKLKGALSKLTGSKSKIAMDAQIAELKKAVEAKQPVALDAATVIKQIADRDAMAKRVTPYIGYFAMDGMFTAEDVAAYAAKKLDIDVKPGHAAIAMDGYLQAAKTDYEKIASDSKPAQPNNTKSAIWGGKK